MESAVNNPAYIASKKGTVNKFNNMHPYCHNTKCKKIINGLQQNTQCVKLTL